jgi:hypothetical protein
MGNDGTRAETLKNSLEENKDHQEIYSKEATK